MNKISFIFSSLFLVLAPAANISSLCQKEAPNQISFSKNIEPRPSTELSIILWNAQKISDSDFLKDLQLLAKTSDILLLQEAMHSTGFEEDLTEKLPFHFSFHKSFCNSDQQATGVLNSARSELFHNLTLVSPDTEPISSTPKVSAYSQVLIDGQIVHLINTHALNFNLGSAFERQIYQVAKSISQLSGPVVWAGDFNTWSSSRQEYLKKITTSLKMTHLKPIQDPRKLILDHIFIRGLIPIKTEVLIKKSSDHYPIRSILKLEKNNLLQSSN